MVTTFWIVLFWKNVEKYGKNGRFSGRLRPDWGSTARAATAGLGSKGLIRITIIKGVFSSWRLYDLDALWPPVVRHNSYC